MQTIIYILPELFLSIAIMFLLMLGVFIKKSFKLVNMLTILSLIFTIALVLNQSNEIIKIFNESYIIDKLSIFMKVLTLLFCVFVLLTSKDYIKTNSIDKIEYPIIILAAAYMLWLYKRVIFGKMTSSEIKEMTDLNKTEIYVFASLVFLTLFFGIYPEPLFNTISISVNNLIENYQSDLNFHLSQTNN